MLNTNLTAGSQVAFTEAGNQVLCMTCDEGKNKKHVIPKVIEKPPLKVAN